MLQGQLNLFYELFQTPDNTCVTLKTLFYVTQRNTAIKDQHRSVGATEYGGRMKEIILNYILRACHYASK
jgi:hypothetical protein